MQTRWPLHPKPYSYETLERYVRRLSECYYVSYKTFCLRALGIDSETRPFQEPTLQLLQRLSWGTGITVSVLEQMTLNRIWARLLQDMREYDENAQKNI